MSAGVLTLDRWVRAERARRRLAESLRIALLSGCWSAPLWVAGTVSASRPWVGCVELMFCMGVGALVAWFRAPDVWSMATTLDRELGFEGGLRTALEVEQSDQPLHRLLHARVRGTIAELTLAPQARPVRSGVAVAALLILGGVLRVGLPNADPTAAEIQSTVALVPAAAPAPAPAPEPAPVVAPLAAKKPALDAPPPAGALEAPLAGAEPGPDGPDARAGEPRRSGSRTGAGQGEHARRVGRGAPGAAGRLPTGTVGSTVTLSRAGSSTRAGGGAAGRAAARRGTNSPTGGDDLGSFVTLPDRYQRLVARYLSGAK